jgi:hypothetical protein
MTQIAKTLQRVMILFTFILLTSCSTPHNLPSPTITPTLTPKPTSSPTPTPTIWTITNSPGINYRAIHMGENLGTNLDGGVNELSPDYFEWLRDLNANWVGISVALEVDDSMDSTVERRYSGVRCPTYTDDTLIKLIRAFRQHNFNVYLTLAFENPYETPRPHSTERWKMGDPDMYNEDSNILPEFWPWALEHPDHKRFVSEFWQTYTDQAVHFGQIAEQEGVGLYSLGTETDRLMRTRQGRIGPNDFREEVHAMIQAVREVYHSSLTYDRYYNTLLYSDFYGGNEFWGDAGFDVIGISAYFPLVNTRPTGVISVEELESSWEWIFKQYLIPLHTSYPDKPILFTEFGYTDSISAPYQPDADNSVLRVFIDTNGNSLDDGQETQANIIKALFNVMDRHPGVLLGIFPWGNRMASDFQYYHYYWQRRGWDLRGKLSEDVVRVRYDVWRNNP